MTSSIHITGGLGFIGSNLIRWLNERNIIPFIYDYLEGEKWRNVAGLRFVLRHPDQLFSATEPFGTLIHLGANVDTTERFNGKLWENNVGFSLKALKHFESGRTIYASSAAVYGSEEQDFTERIYGPRPLNAYGFSKLSLDQAVFGASPQLYGLIYGLRFFNVYGPNEGLKDEMASAVHKALSHQLSCDQMGGIYTEFKQSENGHGYERTSPHWCLFKSDRSDIDHGDQRRDFIHVEDVCEVIGYFALGEPAERGVYNVGSGIARSFKEMVTIIDPTYDIEYRDMPAALRNAYQYRTCADLTKLRAAGYTRSFITLEEGIARTKETL